MAGNKSKIDARGAAGGRVQVAGTDRVQPA
jgi:hypothetical protein